MTPGGMLVVGTTVLIAAASGGLATLAIAAAVGGGAYATARWRANKIPEGVLAVQREALMCNIEMARRRDATSDELDRLESHAESALRKFTKKIDEQRAGNDEVAILVGIAGFACPPLGCAAIACMTAEKWLPTLNRVPKTHGDMREYIMTQLTKNGERSAN